MFRSRDVRKVSKGMQAEDEGIYADLNEARRSWKSSQQKGLQSQPQQSFAPVPNREIHSAAGDIQ